MKQTAAQRIVEMAKTDFTGATNEAIEIAARDEQDYANEVTILEFKDGSQVKFDSMQNIEIVGE